MVRFVSHDPEMTIITLISNLIMRNDIKLSTYSTQSRAYPGRTLLWGQLIIMLCGGPDYFDQTLFAVLLKISPPC